MTIIIGLSLDVGEQDSEKDAIESAQNQMRLMNFEELFNIMDYEVLD